MPIDPRTRDGATRATQRASPGAAPGRPRSSPTSTRSAGLSRPRRPSEPILAFMVQLSGPLSRGASPRAGRGAAISVREGLVRLDDLLHELVADDIAVVEIHEGDALDLADD